MRMNMRRRLDDGGACLIRRRRDLLPGIASRGRRDDHPAVRLAYHVLGDLADEVVKAPAATPQASAAADQGGFLGTEHDCLHPSAPCLVDDREPGATGAHGGRGDLYA